MTKKLRLDMLCTGRWMRHIQNRTALKVGNQTTVLLKNLSRGKNRTPQFENYPKRPLNATHIQISTIRRRPRYETQFYFYS